MIVRDLDLQDSSDWRLMYVNGICKEEEYEINVQIGSGGISGSDNKLEIRLYGNSINGNGEENTEWLQLRLFTSYLCNVFLLEENT